MGNVVLTRWAGVAGVALALLAGCSSGSGSSGPSTTAPATPTTTSASPRPPASADDLKTAAAPALQLVGQYVPSGYASGSVSSGFDWAKGSNQVQDDTLNGPHLLQIACSGTGALTTSVQVTGKKQGHDVTCGGRAVSVPFDGKLNVQIDGKPGNTGVYAWRVLARS